MLFMQPRGKLEHYRFSAKADKDFSILPFFLGLSVSISVNLCPMKISRNLRIAFAAITILWLVYFINFVLPVDLRLYGLVPRHIDGLWGIVAAPFLHVDIHHLMANSGALFILLAVSLSYSRPLTIRALLLIMLAGGGMTWLFGRGGVVHIGASGIIFGLIGFLMCLGVFRGDWKTLIISIVIAIFYGGALHSLLIYIPGISWTGHLFGFLSGVLAAWWFRSVGRKKKLK
jgi:membrane associated rhomboid family serine protease